MTELFGIPLNTLASILLVTTLVILVGVALLALSNLIFFKIGVRNIPRRRTQMMLIIFALMLSTTLLSSVLATGDVITGAIQSVAVFNLGNVDETVEGGHGALGVFDDDVYYRLLPRFKNDPNIAAIGASLTERGLLIADETSRQVRSGVTALAIIPGSEQGFGGMQNDTGKGHLRISDLKTNEVYLNHTVAQYLNAHAGDNLYLYSQRWPGQRYELHVRAIVANGGLIGETAYILAQNSTFLQIEGMRDGITQVFIENRGGGGVSGADLSDQVTEKLYRVIPPWVHVIEVKQQGIEISQKATDIFSRIFTLFCLFALAVGLLLIFLIFVLLAAERRAEMGMARAIGVQRRHLVLMFLFEGTLYDFLASLVGLGFGVGIGALLVIFLGPILARFDFPLKLTFQPRSLEIAYCLGVIFTFCSVALSSWLVSRMTIVDAMRDLPESGRPTSSLGELCLCLLGLLRILGVQLLWKPLQGGRGKPPLQVAPDRGTNLAPLSHSRKLRRIVLEQLPETLLSLVSKLIVLGFVPLLVGYWLMQYGLKNALIVPFSLGFSLIVIGGGLLLKAVIEPLGAAVVAAQFPKFGINRWKKLVQRIFAAVVGLIILAYWALPFDVLAGLGLPRFEGGIEVFFLAAAMMVLGAVVALIANAELIVGPLLALTSVLPGLKIMTRLASAYPLHRRFRTALSIVMFSLVIFAMTVMAVITNAMQNTYANIDVQTGGYDIQAVSYFKPIPDIRSELISHGINPNVFSAIGERTETEVGVLQTNNTFSAWHLYPAQVVSGGFLQGFGVKLAARARGFTSDSAVWQALQTHSNYALIDDDALPYGPNSAINSPVYDPNAPSAGGAGQPSTPPGLDPYLSFALNGIYQGDTTFSPPSVWVTDLPTSLSGVNAPTFLSGDGLTNASAKKLTIIGVVDNSDSAHFGLYISSAGYGKIVPDPSAPEVQTYYFKVAPGQDKRALSLALGSAFLDDGLETTVLEDAVWQVRGPRILLSDVLLGVVGLTLLLGVAALAITGTRAVIERRQQIGMLRSLGCSRRLLQGAFLCESFFVGCVGSILGVVLGLILSSNIFAVNFFEQYNTGLTFSVPWEELGLIVGVALLASLLAAILPAWQAGRIAPSEALRS